jgi:preprotein translocase subunit YajC
MTHREALTPEPGHAPGRLTGHGTQLEGCPDMGTMAIAAAAKSSSSSFLPLLIIIVLFGLFYVTIIRPQRNRQRAAQATQKQAMPGQRVRTTAGIYGTLISGDDRDVVVEIAPGVQITMLRRGIMDVVPEDDQGGSPVSQTTPDTGEEDTKPADDRGDLTI